MIFPLARVFDHRNFTSKAITFPYNSWRWLSVEVLIVALQDYVRSLAASRTVSKTQVFRFIEMEFSRADKDHDGELNFEELAAFTHAIARPPIDQR